MSKFQRIATKILLFIFVFVSVGGSFLYARPAKAIPVEVISDLPSLAERFIKTAAVNIAIQSFSYFLRRVAYDTAVWLASGNKGQSPFAQYKDFGSYMKDVGDNAAGVAIEALGSPYGLNLCKIPDPKIDLAMRIGLTRKYLDLNANLNTQSQGVNKPNCTWSTFQNEVLSASNWQSQFGSSDDIARKFNVAFSLEQTDVGILLGATEKIDNYVAQQTEAAKLQRQEGDGYNPKTTLISGEIVTPAKNIAEEAQSQNPSEQKKSAEAGFFATLGTGAIGSIASAGSLFFNTLASQMLKNWQEKGMLPLGICVGGVGGEGCKTLQDTLSSLEGQLGRGGRQSAQALFSDLLTPPNLRVDQYNLLLNFTNCPANPSAENCVADNGLAQAAQEANVGKAVTIREAIEKNWLHGEWKLVSPDRIADNTDASCHQRAYCYANIAKLRKARILPLGFEIATLNSNPDKPWTLKQVVDGFNDCNFIKDINGNVVGVDNDPVNKPFCHLIDPNWVIKAPPATCNFMAFGSTPAALSGTANRTQECVDMTTCVAYDKDGNCATQGYCTREKNVWKVDANKCDAQYRTCQSFQNANGITVSYLYRTLDTGFCTQDTVGCSAYSLKKDASGKWTGYSPADINSGENSVIYFNNKVSTNCSANSDGCSAFKTADTADNLYLRKAPYYAQCYDTDTSTLAVDWPRSASDLNKLGTKPECSGYAPACIADEVSCNWYQPISYSGDRIPGKFTPAQIVNDAIVWNDQCDARCVGYSAYKEMPSSYSNGQSVAYIIPSSGAACSAADEGCASFTNLSDTNNGVEKVEHFSYLRPCILPDANKQKKFYTYEGSAIGGFQLKSFVLEQDSDGSPKYFYRSSRSLENYDTVCNESLYRSGLASPDCRQFNDDAGQVYYKLLSKTIAVSTMCTPYRLNDTEMETVASSQGACDLDKGKFDAGSQTCQVCFQNGEYRDGQCFYYGLPGGAQDVAGTSKTCAASVSSCRAYKGNTGNNVRNIFSNNFEQSVLSDALSGWSASGVTQSLESTHTGEHSLSYTGSQFVSKTVSLTLGQSYDLVFWAKGSAGETVTVTLENDSIQTFGTISVGDSWQSYHLGPVELKGTASDAQVKFAVNGRLFLDNVSLKEISDYVYVVKNTLKVDPVCDSNVNDNLPGEALGCSQYKTPDNNSIYLTGFTSLCRENAIGCTALFDTANTPNDPESRAYNVWLSGPEGQTVTKIMGGTSYSCQVALGQSGCYVNTTGITIAQITAGGGVISTSTVYVQADTPTSSPIYLVASKNTTCNAVDVGCSKAGKVTETPTGRVYTDVFIKKDPASFDTTLCQSEAVGCNAYSSANGSLFFKDPAVIGQKVCAYKENIVKDGVKYNGWFWKDVGVCQGGGASGSALCSSDSDCTGGATCQGKGEQACYPSYLQSGNNYGLWSYGDSGRYSNFVGECAAAQSGCTEFIDRNENNKTYYLINDDKLKSQQTQCNGQVSEKNGCILFDKTDSPNKLWNTAASYAASTVQNGELVAPVAGSGSSVNDANVVLKVSRDRECGEWLQCRSSHRVFDPQSGTYKEVCDDVGRCDKVSGSTGNGLINCANWVDNSHDLSGQVLTETAYRNRSTDWRGEDFSGFSILNTFPLEELSEVNVGSATNTDWRLAKTMGCGGGANCKTTNPNNTACKSNAVGLACGRSNIGVCMGAGNPVCVQNLDDASSNAPRQSISPSCRAYPEETSPFPNSSNIENSVLFNSANVCAESPTSTTDRDKAYACECSYTKASYGDSLTKYWNFNNPNSQGITGSSGQIFKSVVPGICVGGDNADQVCSTDSDCSGGVCQKLKKQSKLIGWQGYCIEPDLSRPINAEQGSFACLTWFPKDSITGALDINNQHVEAGFQATEASGKYYCLNAKGNQTVTSVLGSDVAIYDKLLGTKEVKSDQVNDRTIRVLTVNASTPVYRDEIDYLLISATGNSDWFPNGTNKFFIRNGYVSKYTNQTQIFTGNGSSLDLVNDSSLLFAGEATGLNIGQEVWSDGRDKSAWYMRWDDGQGDVVSLPHYQYADPYDTTVVQFRDLLRADCGSVDTDRADNYQGNCLNENVDNEDDGCAIRAMFDTSGKLDHVSLVCFTGEGTDFETVTFNVSAGLRETCTSVAQTAKDAPYTSVGWTDRLWKRSNFAIDPSGLNYKNNLAGSPFGSVSMQGLLVPDQLVSIFSHYAAATPALPAATVGSPYACTDRNCLQTNPSARADQTGQASGRNFDDAQSSLSQIFAKISSVWNWTLSSTPSAGFFYKNNTQISSVLPAGDASAVRPYDLTETLSSPNRAPQVRPLGTCKPGGKCLEGLSAGISVNDKTSGNVVFSSNVGVVNAKFYGFADKNQMPLKKIKLDWNDGNIVSLDGYFRNQRGTVNGICGSSGTCMISSGAAGVYDLDTGKNCSSGSDCLYLDNCVAESKAPSFGQIIGQTCDSAYFRFDHVYQCTRDGTGWTNTCPDAQTQSLYGGCCVFKPAVQLKDNWGWCNGSCAGPTGGAGCYDGGWQTNGTDECNNSSGAYTSFSGNVIVAPN